MKSHLNIVMVLLAFALGMGFEAFLKPDNWALAIGICVSTFAGALGWFVLLFAIAIGGRKIAHWLTTGYAKNEETGWTLSSQK